MDARRLGRHQPRRAHRPHRPAAGGHWPLGTAHRPVGGQSQPGGPSGMPGLKPRSSPKSPAPKQSRKPRPHGFSRRRMAPTHLEHVVESCPDCGTPLSGGWTHRTREVIDLPRVPAQVTEHVFIARVCSAGATASPRRSWTGRLGEAALGGQPGQPDRHPAGGGEAAHPQHPMVSAHRPPVAPQRGRHRRPSIAWRNRPGPRCRASGAHPRQPRGHADETGWREDGANGYVWTFSTPTDRYFLRRGRGKSVVDEVLGDGFAGVLVCDFYAAYHHYDGPKQRCWAHLLRDIHDLQGLYPDDGLAQWAEAVHGLYAEAKAFVPRNSSGAPHNRPGNSACWPSAVPSWMTAAAHKLCRRIERHIKELFVFVGEPRRRRTTTPPSAACATWSSAARSAGAPDQRKGPTPR